MIPHSYLNASCLMDNLIRLRKDLFEKTKIKVSINDYLIKAVGLALKVIKCYLFIFSSNIKYLFVIKMVPELNSNIADLNNTEDVKYNQLKTVDISIAVATDKGLITPIIKNADKLNVEEISNQVKILADKAKANKLQPHEFQGGGFSISNLGMFGIKEFSAVINPPQIAILAIGNADVVINHENKRETKTIVKLSFDERCVDLQTSHRFLDYLKYFIENPMILVGQNEKID